VDYLRIYNEFITDRKQKEPEEFRGYSYFTRRSIKASNGKLYENHHILPVCEGGNNKDENIVALTPSEHFFAHLLLAKAKKGVHWAALWAMANIKKTRKKDFRYVIMLRRWYETARIKSKQNNSGKNHPNSKKVVCVNTGQIFETVTQAKKFAGNSSVSNALLNGRKSAGFYWAYFDDLDDTSPEYLATLLIEMINAQKQRKIEGDKVAGVKRTIWTEQKIKNEAMKHKQKTDFAQKSGSAYFAARKLGILNEVCSHMDVLREKFDIEKTIEIAKNYKTKTAFANAYPNLYAGVIRKKMQQKAFKHMPEFSTSVTLSFDEVLKVASQYEKIMDFHKANKRLYTYAYKNNWIKKLFSVSLTGKRPVINLNTGEIYASQAEASLTTKASKTKISLCCNGKRKTAGGYRWAYADQHKEAA
jgi:hypothetical protein